jgi:tetratricopeptide (TPR) repeat protein
MSPEAIVRSGWRSAGIMAVWLVLSAGPARAQSQRSAPTKPSPSRETEDPLAPLLKQAQEAMDKMDFEAALEPLQKYIAQRPDDPYAHFQLGYSYVGLKRPADAKSEFSRAIALDPKMAAAHLNLGLVLMDNDPGAAAQAFLNTAQLQPTESRPRFLAGFSLEHAGKFPEAIEQYRSALALAPNDYEIHFALGRVLLRTNDDPGAEVQFRAAVAARGDSAPARLGLANALLAEKKTAAAIDALGEYLKLSPGDRGAHYDRASALFDLDRYDEALAELDLADAGSPPAADTLKMRGGIYMNQKKWKEAGDALTQAIRLSPQDAELAHWIGQVDIQEHDYVAAVNILGQVVKQDPQNADALNDLANAFFLHEDYAAALGAMDQLAKLEPPKPGSWFIRAICYDKLSQKAAAIEAYQKFLDQDNGQHDTEDFQARHRILALQNELGKSPKKK